MTDTAAEPLDAEPLDIDDVWQFRDPFGGYYFPSPDGKETFRELEGRFFEEAGYCAMMRDEGWEITDVEDQGDGVVYFYRHESDGGFGPCAICCTPSTHVYARGDIRNYHGRILCEAHGATPPADEAGETWQDITEQIRAVQKAEDEGAEEWQRQREEDRRKLDPIVDQAAAAMKAQGLTVPDRKALYLALGYHHVLVLDDPPEIK